MAEYIISVDQGTTSTKAFLLDRKGNFIPSSSFPIKQIYPEAGFVEHDAEEIFLSVLKTVADLLISNPEAVGNIDSLALTNQRETTVAFDRNSSLPIANAIVWQCRRTAEICRREIYKQNEPYICKTTGLKLDPYFSATKMRWFMENVEGAKDKADRGELLFGTIDGFLVYKLTNKKSFCSDYSNCSRTMLFDITNLRYDPKLLELFGIKEDSLAQPRPSCSDFGTIELSKDMLENYALTAEQQEVLLSLNGIHITGIAGDQAAALFGQNCFGRGDTKTTYGTGCFTLMNVGEEPVFSDNGLLTSAAWSIDGRTTYALEGSVFQGGAVISWLKDELGLIKEPSECDGICASLEDNGGVYLVPAFTGLGAPYWNPDVRGSIVGLTRGSGRNHIVRAGIESIAYQVTELLELMKEDTGISSTRMKVDGGVCASNFLMQLQSDLLGIDITRARSDEMTAMGVGLLAGLTTGFFTSLEELKGLYYSSKTYSPSENMTCVGKALGEYKKAVKAAAFMAALEGES